MSTNDSDAYVIPTAESEATPKKYIRTLGGDMMIFQKGGVPDFAQVIDMPSPVTPVVETSSTQQPPLSAPAPISIESESIPPDVPAPLAKVPEPVLPVEPPKQSPLQTYASDFKDRIDETHASALTVLAAEQDATPQIRVDTDVTTEESPQKNRWFIGGGIILLIAGLLGVGVGLSKYLVATRPVGIATTATIPIFVDTKSLISGSGTSLIQSIKQATIDPLPVNTVRLLSFATSSTEGTNILTQLNFRAPGILLRNINSEGSMIGIVNTKSGQAPFFVLSVDSYSSTFSGMLSWEPIMTSNLESIYPPYTSGVLSVSTESTTTPTLSLPTPTTTQSISKRVGWRDEVVSNHDVRVYRDASNRSVVLYGYWNQSILIIARDSAAFAEIAGRLATAHSGK